jgi:hypothetical protein
MIGTETFVALDGLLDIGKASEFCAHPADVHKHATVPIKHGEILKYVWRLIAASLL